MGGSVQEMCLRARLARVAPPSLFVDISQKGVLLIDAGSVVTLNQLWKIPHVILVQWVNKLKGQKELSLGVEPGRLCPGAGRC